MLVALGMSLLRPAASLQMPWLGTLTAGQGAVALSASQLLVLGGKPENLLVSRAGMDLEPLENHSSHRPPARGC